MKIKSVITDLTWLDLKIKSGISHLTWLDLKIKSVIADLNMTWELSALIIFQFTPLILLYDLLLLLIHQLSTIEIIWALLEHSQMVFNLIIWRRPDQMIGKSVNWHQIQRVKYYLTSVFSIQLWNVIWFHETCVCKSIFVNLVHPKTARPQEHNSDIDKTSDYLLLLGTFSTSSLCFSSSRPY